jgi:hypothetical protein
MLRYKTGILFICLFLIQETLYVPIKQYDISDSFVTNKM